MLYFGVHSHIYIHIIMYYGDTALPVKLQHESRVEVITGGTVERKIRASFNIAIKVGYFKM